MYQSRLIAVLSELESINSSIQNSVIDSANLEGVSVEYGEEEALRNMTDILICSAHGSIEELIDLLNGAQNNE